MTYLLAVPLGTCNNDAARDEITRLGCRVLLFLAFLAGTDEKQRIHMFGINQHPQRVTIRESALRLRDGLLTVGMDDAADYHLHVAHVM